ncbi:NADP-dependent oxidoreductase domain-containing protein [Aspergillus unguis]
MAPYSFSHKGSPIGLGFGSLCGVYGPPGTTEERVALLNHAYATGLRFWDLADIYGDSEDVVGEWIKQATPAQRDEVFIATKFGLERQPNGMHTFRTDPEYVKTACEKSLKRMKVETIDLYYCHRVDGVTPIEKTIQAMVELKNEGKIRHIGLSEVSATTLRRAHAVHPIAALQMEYSLFCLDIESEILETARELGITIVAYSPIGRGVLTGQFQSHEAIPEGDLRRMYPKYGQQNFVEILKLVDGVEKVARAHGDGTTPAQVALAWLLAQDVIPIPGTKSAARMDENAAAGRLELADQEVLDLRILAQQAAKKIEGTRYPAAVMATLCADTPPL